MRDGPAADGSGAGPQPGPPPPPPATPLLAVNAAGASEGTRGHRRPRPLGRLPCSAGRRRRSCPHCAQAGAIRSRWAGRAGLRAVNLTGCTRLRPQGPRWVTHAGLVTIRVTHPSQAAQSDCRVTYPSRASESLIRVVHPSQATKSRASSSDSRPAVRSGARCPLNCPSPP